MDYFKQTYSPPPGIDLVVLDQMHPEYTDLLIPEME